MNTDKKLTTHTSDNYPKNLRKFKIMKLRNAF